MLQYVKLYVTEIADEFNHKGKQMGAAGVQSCL